MNELETRFPTEIWIHVVSKTGLDKASLVSISLVSSTLREVAQRELFQQVTLHYQSSIGMHEIHVDLDPYKKKVKAICRSRRLCAFIQQLDIAFCDDFPWDAPHCKLSDAVFCKMMDKVAIALPAMIVLRRLSYNAPFLLSNLHKAILLHPSLKNLSITPSTECETPCREASPQQPPQHRLHALEINEWSPIQPIRGISSPLIGPRTCALTSNIFITHSHSLRQLRLPLLLLYDAVAACSILPEFPHLHSLSITRLTRLIHPDHSDHTLADSTERFLLHVHETIRFLDWRPYGGFELSRLPSTCFPNLEALEGEGIEFLLHQQPSLNRLLLVAPRGRINKGREVQEKKSIQALHECRSRSPQLTKLFLEGFMYSMDFVPAISAFRALQELSCALEIAIGNDLSPKLVSLGYTPLKVLIKLLCHLFDPRAMDLPSLLTLTIEVSGTGIVKPTPLKAVIFLASSVQNKSLRRFNYRLAADPTGAVLLDKQMFESFQLHRVRYADGRSGWVAPEGRVMTSETVPCGVHKKCSLNRPLESHSSWMVI